MSRAEDIDLLEGPARQFSQARARRTFEALVEAAAGLFAERGFDATQSPDIAAAAGVAVGTFYNYFSDKKAIYLEVVRRELADGYRDTIGRLTPARFAGKGRRRAIEDTLAILLDHVIASPRAHRVLREMALRDPDVAALQRAFDLEAQRRLAELIAAISTRDDVPDPEATAHVVYLAAVACASTVAEAAEPAAADRGTDGGAPVSRARAQAALTELIHRAVFGRAKAR